MQQTADILTGFKPEHAQLWGRQICHVNHNLHRSKLFGDEALAALIERAPASSYDIISMGAQGAQKRFWRKGELGNTSGMDAIAAIRDGRMWINLGNVGAYAEPYQELVEQIFAEQERHIPGFKPFNTKAGILISSPKAQVYYHCDIPGQSLWQMRGTKRVYIWPNSEPFLKPAQMERVVLGETEEEVEYHTWYDNYAQVIDLAPGEMLHWPLNGPHRVENHDCLNVSMTTEHFTDEIRRVYAVNFANGVLRQRFGLTPKSRETRGVGFWAKAALAVAWKSLKLHKPFQRKRVIDFRLAPKEAGRMIDIPAYQS